jgi:hypothetical protein
MSGFLHGLAEGVQVTPDAGRAAGVAGNEVMAIGGMAVGAGWV